MKTVAIIQARMGSSRLPGKVLLRLHDRTVLEHVIERVRQAKRVDEIWVATTTSQADHIIMSECNKYGVFVHRGSEQDVLGRYYETACLAAADIIVRITSDCPVIEPELIDSILALYLEKQADYASNTQERSYPRGLDAEVFSFEALKRAFLEAVKPEQREHVTPYIYQNPDLFRLESLVHHDNVSHFRWTLDTQEDWELIQAIYDRLYTKGALFSWIDALKLMEREPRLAAINAGVEQKKLEQ